MRLLVASSALLFACASKSNPTLPQVLSTELAQEIARIEPQLLWCFGVPAIERIDAVTGREHCDVGDGMSTIGHAMLYGRMGSFDTISASISPDGRPWRNPGYVNNSNQANSFSRDQLIGLIEATQAVGVVEPLARVWEYFKRTGKLCPDADNNRCDMTDSVSILVRDAIGHPVTSKERAKDEIVVNTEAMTSPAGYQLYLVSRKIMLKAFTGHLTTSYAHSASVLHSRFPSNIWFDVVDRVANHGTPAEFDGIATRLVECMRAWSGPGTEWTWHTNDGCTAQAQGHELVAGGRFLLGRISQ
jgi:hypothetical protein